MRKKGIVGNRAFLLSAVFALGGIACSSGSGKETSSEPVRVPAVTTGATPKNVGSEAMNRVMQCLAEKGGDPAGCFSCAMYCSYPTGPIGPDGNPELGSDPTDISNCNAMVVGHCARKFPDGPPKFEPDPWYVPDWMRECAKWIAIGAAGIATGIIIGGIIYTAPVWATAAVVVGGVVFFVGPGGQAVAAGPAPGYGDSCSAGGGGGDPHMTTFDGLRYDYQGAGEFWLYRSAGAQVDVAARFVPMGDSFSITRAVAMFVVNPSDGVRHRVSIYPGASQVLWVDDAPVTGMADPYSGETVYLAAGYPAFYNGSTLTFMHPGGTFSITPSGVSVAYPNGDARGLLGSNIDNDPHNDLRDASGNLISLDPGQSTNLRAALSTWAILSAGESPFTQAGPSPLLPFDPSFPRARPAPLSDEAMWEAQAACAGVPMTEGDVNFHECVFDVAHVREVMRDDPMMAEVIAAEIVDDASDPNAPMASEVVIAAADGSPVAVPAAEYDAETEPPYEEPPYVEPPYEDPYYDDAGY